MARTRPHSNGRLVVDPAACQGIGICSHLAAGIVTLDRWGFPIVSDEDLSAREARAARRAVRACPRRALALSGSTRG